MGKFTNRNVEKHVEKDHTKNAAWKGIGCVLMLVIPVISIAAASLTVSNPTAQGFIPYQLMGYVSLPAEFFKTEGLATIFYPITQVENLLAVIVFSLTYMVVFGSGISLLYAIIFRVVNPRQYSPLDAPPPKVKAKKYKR